MSQRTTVVNKYKSFFDIYIGRFNNHPQIWGNPFVVGWHGVQGECVELFKQWLLTGNSFGCSEATPSRRRWILDNIAVLRGRKLGCFCKPKACHGDVLAQIADGLLIIPADVKVEEENVT